MTATPAATMDHEGIIKNAKRIIGPDAFYNPPATREIVAQLISLLQQTTREVTKEDVREVIYTYAPAYDKDDQDILWESAPDFEKESTYAFVDHIRSKFIILPRPVVTPVEGK